MVARATQPRLDEGESRPWSHIQAVSGQRLVHPGQAARTNFPCGAAEFSYSEQASRAKFADNQAGSSGRPRYPGSFRRFPATGGATDRDRTCGGAAPGALWGVLRFNGLRGKKPDARGAQPAWAAMLTLTRQHIVSPALQCPVRIGVAISASTTLPIPVTRLMGVPPPAMTPSYPLAVQIVHQADAGYAASAARRVPAD